MYIISAKSYQPLNASDRSKELLVYLIICTKRGHNFLTELAQKNLNDTQVLTQNLSFGKWGRLYAICNLGFILKIML
jgi:hypothetical protein